MTEIPMPGPETYEPTKKSSTGSDCCKWTVIICVILIIGMFVIAMVFMGGILSIFGGGGIGSNYSTRTITSYSNQDIDLYTTYYYDEFYVSSSETMTMTEPDIQFDIVVDDTGSDSISVTIHFAIYAIDQSTFDSIPTWAGLDSYLVEDGDYTNTASDYFNLNNYADTYVWVIWFEASSKTDVWNVDIDLTLRYNWNI
ncbi:MAG: hypothetical protein JW779_10700 [Candidatus Thorarchaeota archaeon]|nr:hypothetical protein [Candidatus Thorarchaeota archaeon]